MKQTLLIVALAMFTTLLANAQPRLVTIGGVCTETIAALGLGGTVVAVDATSTYPEAMQTLPNLGFFGRIGAEAVLAHRPNHVVMIAEADVRGLSAALQSAGIKVTIVAQPQSIDEALTTIAKIGASVGKAKEAEALRTTIDSKRQTIQRLRQTLRVLPLYVRGAKALFVLGRTTAADAMLNSVGAQNAMAASGTVPATAEAVVAAKPDVVLVTKHGAESIGGVTAVLALPGVAATPAGRASRVAVVDDALLLTMGPRLAEGLDALRGALERAMTK
jgi:iron complex transport system substrate-binding protein